MSELLTAEQMRAIERRAMAEGGLTGLDLMEAAGRGVVEAVFAHWPDLAAVPGRAVVLCGPGNNGGDGYVIARLLRGWGWGVDVFSYGDPARLPADAKANCDRWRAAGGAVAPLEAFNAGEAGAGADLAVDALFGTGLSRPLDDRATAALRRLARMRGTVSRTRVVAVDMPSGYCSDSGRALFDVAVIAAQNPDARPGADLTVTFERPRLGHRLDPGTIAAGHVAVKPIGIRSGGGLLRETDGPVARACTIAPERLAKSDADHKYRHGHALVLSGGAGRTGAARLAARAALRVGAGLVTLGVPPAAQQEVACQITALMLRRIADGAALSALLADRRFNALCLGPGFGTAEAQAALVKAALEAGRATVLDADALTLLAGDSGLSGVLHDGCVLTPHGGEFARLFPDIHARLAEPPRSGPAYSKVDAAREAADRAGCVVLFKGPDTVIAAPGGAAAVHSAHGDRAAPWLATAGAGDVLAGLIAGLLARGLPPVTAAETAVWLHVDCARAVGPGVIAEDLPEALPGVLAALGV
ncbi:NAD(P)H-hydrate dehydratase [Jhaorihella thermophila]|uniref:Bifunctional NAD(P)H-hydrate repair enzyme n=1 Tax=Jhaorihella thermophila TaxID=488547 RepID=A0A1H5W4U3_9RHOB|nr:NAD(P)H-hydrate dehydratase [Jhaorihella thermophila]SEF94512.1 yjeF C-terminal region, hydroxyethylthiazole kinase-related/yjeF N-terminal region [Jhaorihella thermophila]